MTRMLAVEEETINGAGNQDLVRGLTMWRQVMQGREEAMVENIYRYCRENVFERGAFLVGAAHRSGIVKAIDEFSNADVDLIAWKLYL